MCHPAIFMALAVAGTAAQQQQQTKAISAQNKATAANAEQQRNALALKQTAQQEGLSQEAFNRQRQALREQGAIMAAIGESGVSGVSPFRSLQTAATQAHEDFGIINRNIQFANSGFILSEQNLVGSAESKIDSANAQQASPIMQIMQIGLAGAQGYSLGQDFTNALPGSPPATFGGPVDPSGNLQFVRG